VKNEALKRLWTGTLYILYPPRCGGCDRRDTLFCERCRKQVVAPSPGTVVVPNIEEVFCAGMFGGVLRAAIHKLKYESDSPLAELLGGLIVEALAPTRLPRTLQQDPPTLVPVPLHPQREKSRGYNQCALLAEEVARETGWLLDNSLHRVRPTKSQVGLHMEERRQNVAGAFEWRGGKAPENVLLVDDVCTTGATLAECARALRKAGVGRVFAAAVARAAMHGPHADL
jgi:ComF family protein